MQPMIIVSDCQATVDRLNEAGLTATTEANGNLKGHKVAVYAATPEARDRLVDRLQTETINAGVIGLPAGQPVQQVINSFTAAFQKPATKGASYSLLQKSLAVAIQQTGPLFCNALDEQSKAIAEFTGAPREFIDLSMLTVISALAIGRYAVGVRAGWTERPIISASIVADSGGAKTPAIKAVTDYLFDRQIKSLEAVEDKGTISLNNASRFVVGDTTIEALSTILANNDGRGVLKLSDEKADHFASMSRYSKSAIGDRPLWLHLWNGSPYVIDRKTNAKPLPIKCFGASTLGGIQPSRLSLIYNDESADGLEAREWVVYPDPTPIRLDAPERAEMGLWHGVIDRLITWREESNTEQVIPLAPEALERFQQWRFDLLDGKRKARQEICPWTAKAPAHVARCALLFAIGEAATAKQKPERVTLAHVNQAIGYLSLLNSHRRRARLEAGGSSIEAVAIDLARYIIETHATKLDTFDLRHSRCIAGVRDEATLRKVLAELFSARWITTAIPRRNDQPLPHTVHINSEVHKHAAEMH